MQYAVEADPTHIPLVHWHQFADFRVVEIRYKNVRKSDTNERYGKQTVADVCPHPLLLNDLQFHPFKCQDVKYGSLVGPNKSWCINFTAKYLTITKPMEQLPTMHFRTISYF